MNKSDNSIMLRGIIIIYFVLINRPDIMAIAIIGVKLGAWSISLDNTPKTIKTKHKI